MIKLRQAPVPAASHACAPPGALPITGAPPARLGPYRLLRPLGEGGMAVVHLAAGPDGRPVAVKVLRLPAAATAEARCRLAREVAAMRRVRSPFVAEVTDADLAGELPYIVTRFVPGPTLAQVVAGQGPLRGRALQRLAYGLAEALAAVHASRAARRGHPRRRLHHAELRGPAITARPPGTEPGL
jgi:serine/threonine protein kinase